MLICLYDSWSGVMVVSENSNAPFSGLERMSQNVPLVSLKINAPGFGQVTYQAQMAFAISAFGTLTNPHPTM